MSETPPRPSRRLLWRGCLLGVLGLGLLMASSFAMPGDATTRNDARTWLTTLGIFAGLGTALAGAVMFLLGLVKRFREPRPPRDPAIRRPTALQAVAIVVGSMVLGLSTCGAFASAFESNSGFAAVLLIGGAVGFVASGVLFLYGVVVFVRRLRGK
jgi:hypothetical protein